MKGERCQRRVRAIHETKEGWHVIGKHKIETQEGVRRENEE